MSGDAGKFRNFAAFYEKSLQILRKIVIDYTDISQEEYNAHKLEDWWFTAEEAKQYGIFDEYATEHIL
jgi:ATP-dependent protease ClpP protease subunit